MSRCLNKSLSRLTSLPLPLLFPLPLNMQMPLPIATAHEPSPAPAADPPNSAASSHSLPLTLAEDLQLSPFASLPLFMILTLPASVYFHFMPNPGWSRSSVSNGKSRSQGISSHPFPFFLL